MDLMSLRSRSHVNASMVSTREDHLFIYNYIILLMKIILRPILLVHMGLDPLPTTYVSGTLPFCTIKSMYKLHIIS